MPKKTKTIIMLQKCKLAICEPVVSLNELTLLATDSRLQLSAGMSGLVSVQTDTDLIAYTSVFCQL